MHADSLIADPPVRGYRQPMNARDLAIPALRTSLARDPALGARLGLSPSALDSAKGRSAVLASRLYPPEQSWTRAPAWWFKVPLEKTSGEGALFLLAERANGVFHLLAVERAWLRDQDARLARFGREDALNLSLDATPAHRFFERRGAGLDFSRFYIGDLDPAHLRP